MSKVILALLLLLASCRRAPAPAPPPAPAHEDDWNALPSRDAYAGSAVCKDCHEKNYERWSHDWHSRALAAAQGKSVVGRFDRAHFRGESSEAWMSRSASDYVMRTKNREGQLLDYPVSWVIGGKRMQDTVTVMPDGRWQVLPVYFHITGGGAWVDYNEAKQGRVTPEHPYFWTNFRRTANKECLECHATGLDLHYDRAEHAWSTSFADAGVACEACHGPGARHAETKAKGDIVHPGHASKEIGLSVCARCHGPREPLFPLLDAKDQFRPGQRYAEKFTPLVVVDGMERSGEYFADGRPSSSSFEYQSLIQSRCFRDGGATCLTCHTAPHEDHGADELKPEAPCVGCHKMPASHSHHVKATCVDCHMPKVLSGVLDHFADHALDVPNPANTLRHGVPNACNLCHKDRAPAEMQQAMEQWWPDAAQRQARRVRLAEAIDEKTAASSLPSLIAVLNDGTEAPTLRGAAATLLGQRFPPDAVRVLVPLLHDPDPLVRTKLIEALGFAQARGAASAIAELANDPALNVRQMAALVLASFGDERGFASLEKLAADPATKGLFRPHVMLGIRAANRGDMDRARREMETAVNEAPYAVDALVFLADLSARRGDMAQARQWLEEALRFDPGHRGARGRLAAMR